MVHQDDVDPSTLLCSSQVNGVDGQHSDEVASKLSQCLPHLIALSIRDIGNDMELS